MGYYTDYSLKFDSSPSHEEYESVIKSFSNFVTEYGDSHLLDVYECGCNGIKWYNHDADMKRFSKLHPNVVFELSGEGEDSEDLWVKYYKDGKVQIAKAIISYEKFDEKKLK